MKRLGILFFYDKFNVVDKYVEYLLEDIARFFSKTLIVVNGQLDSKEKNKLLKFGEVFQRENNGYDVWAYKTGLEHIGWDRLSQYDEIVLFNNTIMGPIDSFSETFQKMDPQDIDFWGITKFFEYREGDPFGTIEYEYIPEHIQSHFIAIRKRMFLSKEFRSYWEKMPIIRSYEEAVGYHEAIFTKKFAELGYTWKTSVDMEELRTFSNHPILMAPKKMIKEYNCPIFKKRSFFHDVGDFLKYTSGETPSELMAYLKNNTNYDTDMIWETILPRYNQYDIVKNLNLEYTLSTKIADTKLISSNFGEKRAALIIHIYFEDLVGEMVEWLSAVPSFFDVYVTVVSEEMKKMVESSLSKLKVNKVEVRVIENRGRDVSALLRGVNDVIMEYDVACFLHDKKTAQVKPESVGASFAFKCFENTISNQYFVFNILQTFEENPRLGLLTPPAPIHSEFFPTVGGEWGMNLVGTKALAKKLGLKVPIDGEKPPIAPLGTMFWFRPKALEKLFDVKWDFEDYPKEPNDQDGTMLHFIERIYSYVVQDAGYYPAYVMSDKYSAIEFNNLYYYVREFNRSIVSDKRHFDERLKDMLAGKTRTSSKLQNILNSKTYKALKSVGIFKE